MEIQKRKSPDTGKVEGAAQMNEQAHCTNPFPPLSTAEKLVVIVSTGLTLLFTLWLVAIHLEKVIYA